MAGRVAEFEVLGPWALETSRRFWEGFAPAALAGGPARPGLRTVFCAEGDWRYTEAEVTQAGDTARVLLVGDGDLDTAAAQACRFLALDVDGRGWPEVARRDPVIADAQTRLPGLRPCGFHSPYEAAARLRAELIGRHGQGGAFPAPRTLARGAPSPRSRTLGGHTAPGPSSTCVRCVSSGPARSPVAEPPGLPGRT